MEINTLSVTMVLTIAGTSFSLTGWLILMLSFIFKISNFTGNKLFLIHPKAFLMIFLGSLSFSLSNIYDGKYVYFCIQILVSGLNFGIYIVQRKTYKTKLESEIC